MKKYLFMLMAVTLLGCQSDDDSSSDSNNNDIANLRSTGDSAEELLRAANFNQLEVEFLYVNGAQPEAASLANLKSFLEQRLNKPDGVRFTERVITNSTGSEYTIDEIVQLEQDNRTSFSRDNIIAVSIIVADQPNDRDEGNSVVLGTAYRNTSLVIYQSTIERFSGGVGQSSRVTLESIVYNHEFAHLMGLVNLGTPLQSAHEDADNNKHCNVDGCLMFFEINGGNILDMMNMSSIPELDPQCLADLQANGGK